MHQPQALEPWSPRVMFRPSLGLLVSLANSSNRLDHTFLPSGWEPQTRKAVGGGDGWMAEKSQEHENGESWKTCKNSAQKSGLLLGGQ